MAEQTRAGTWLMMGEVMWRTQAVVIESLQRSPQTTAHPSYLLLDMGSGQGGVAVPHVRFSVSLDERRRKREDLIS